MGPVHGVQLALVGASEHAGESQPKDLDPGKKLRIPLNDMNVCDGVLQLLCVWENELAEKVVDPPSSKVILRPPWGEVCRGALATRKLKLKSHSGLARNRSPAAGGRGERSCWPCGAARAALGHRSDRQR